MLASREILRTYKMNLLLNSLQYLYVGIGCRDKILQSLLF